MTRMGIAQVTASIRPENDQCGRYTALRFDAR